MYVINHIVFNLISQATPNLITQSEVESRIKAEPLLQHEVGWRILKATENPKNFQKKWESQ